jgi:DNA-binding response OmpR family regulator
MSLPSHHSSVTTGPERVVTVLAVSNCEEDRRSLRNIFQHSNWVMHEAACCRDARTILGKYSCAVVLCERHLPDGDWKQVLRMLESMEHPPLLVVTSHLADEVLWAEVLNLGGYDLLPKPFDQNEVVRTVSVAWLHWKDSHRELRRKTTAQA